MLEYVSLEAADKAREIENKDKSDKLVVLVAL